MLSSITAPCALHGRSVLTTCTPCRSLCIHLVHTTQCNTYERLLGINRMVEISIQKCFGFKGSLQLQKCIKSGSKLFLYQFSHSCIALLSPKWFACWYLYHAISTWESFQTIQWCVNQSLLFPCACSEWPVLFSLAPVTRTTHTPSTDLDRATDSVPNKSLAKEVQGAVDEVDDDTDEGDAHPRLLPSHKDPNGYHARV